ncbi:serine hydrolase [Pedobacter nutrimenti]|uniref:Tetratricopeptide repeat protein n=1 Tax=Pedobacter nutrimenti TaxID=1241337 RepID=A0A318UL15_9SPHI|nr:serine hydrolase [Pedobacter nutrimenti]PYF77064.1 tetratricopeptide repeat protein [Pedobacter nutrimenti]
MKDSLKCILFYALLSLVLTSSSKAQDKKVLKIDSLVDRYYQFGFFNGNLLVADQDNVIYKGSMGFADASKKNRLSEEYRFVLGPLTREFGLVALMLLKEEGKLNLEDKLSLYLPDLPAWAEKISIKNLIQWSSGIPERKETTSKNDPDGMALLKEIKELDFDPGSKYQYSDLSVYVQQKLIEKISKQTFDKFLEEHVFKPNNLKNALVSPTSKDVLIARAFKNDGTEDQPFKPVYKMLSLTLDDFYRWTEALYGLKIIKSESLKFLFGSAQPGKQNVSWNGDKLIRHTNTGSFLSNSVLQVSDLSEKRTVILFSNLENARLQELNTGIQAILDGSAYRLPKRSVFIKIEKQLNSLNGRQIIAFYEYLKAKNEQDYNFDDDAELYKAGLFLFSKSRYEDALVLLEHNTKLFPKSVKTLNLLAEVYLKKGDKKNALSSYKKLLQLNPSDKTAREGIESLEKPVLQKNAKPLK